MLELRGAHSDLEDFVLPLHCLLEGEVGVGRVVPIPHALHNMK